MKEYETKLLEMEEENAMRELGASTAISESLSKLSHLLRQVLRAQGGEDISEKPKKVEEDKEKETLATTRLQSPDMRDWCLTHT